VIVAVELESVLVRFVGVYALLFSRTVQPGMNFDPVTWRVNDPDPVSTVEGLRAVFGSSTGNGFLTTMVAAFDVPPPGVPVTTVTWASWANEIFDAGTNVLICVGEM
jgi:hypothetical protein